MLAERRLLAGKTADIGELVQEVLDPPIETIGALPLDAFLSRHARGASSRRGSTRCSPRRRLRAGDEA